MARRLMIVAGEASGDRIAALALRALRERCAPGELEVCGVGGDELAAAGMEPLLHHRELSVMGLWDVLRRAGRLLGALRRVERLARELRPDLLLLVDYPGFNLRLAGRLRPVVPRIMYYVSPKYWAWKRKRIHGVAELTDRQALIFPFEEADYRALGCRAEYVGHPVFDLVEQAPERGEARHGLGLDPADRVLAMFPGSRGPEIRRHLPLLRDCLLMLRDLDCRVLVQLADSLDRRLVENLSLDLRGVRVIQGRYYECLAAADLGLVASGTASLEAAALGLDHLVFYRLDRLTGWVARRMVRVPWASPVNIVAGEELVPEYLQDGATGLRLANWAVARLEWLRRRPEESARGPVLGERVRELLGGPGASARVAEILHGELWPDGVPGE